MIEFSFEAYLKFCEDLMSAQTIEEYKEILANFGCTILDAIEVITKLVKENNEMKETISFHRKTSKELVEQNQRLKDELARIEKRYGKFLF